MFDEVEKYKNNGHFFFKKGDDLKQVSATVPEMPGVFYILRLSKGHVDLVYIGKSGTLKQNGKFKNQLLNKSLNNEQNGTKRQDFFNQKMVQEDIDGLDIYWFVTQDKNHHDLPEYVEGTILQRFYEVYGRLPEWNGEY